MKLSQPTQVTCKEENAVMTAGGEGAAGGGHPVQDTISLLSRSLDDASSAVARARGRSGGVGRGQKRARGDGGW